MSKADQYAQALRDLDEMHAAGKVDTAGYEVRRQRLLAESSRPQRSLTVKIILFVVFVALIVLAINILGRAA